MRQHLTDGSQFLSSHKDVQQNSNKLLLLRTREGFNIVGVSEVKPLNLKLELLFEVAGMKNTVVFVKCLWQKSGLLRCEFPLTNW